MDYRLLGKSGLRVSEACLGTMTFDKDWGWGAPEKTCRKIHDRFREAGGNFVDSANMYTGGSSETILGDIVKGHRDEVVIATKFTDAQGDGSDPNIAMGMLADANNYDDLEDIFADQLRLDYTSLFDGEVQTLAASELMKSWQAALPGFDATQHLIGRPLVSGSDDTALAVSYVQATHSIDGAAWVVGGRYRIQFRRIEGDWRIVLLTYDALTESGDRALAEKAAARVKSRGE